MTDTKPQIGNGASKYLATVNKAAALASTVLYVHDTLRDFVYDLNEETKMPAMMKLATKFRHDIFNQLSVDATKPFSIGGYVRMTKEWNQKNHLIPLKHAINLIISLGDGNGRLPGDFMERNMRLFTWRIMFRVIENEHDTGFIDANEDHNQLFNEWNHVFKTLMSDCDTVDLNGKVDAINEECFPKLIKLATGSQRQAMYGEILALGKTSDANNPALDYTSHDINGDIVEHYLKEGPEKPSHTDVWFIHDKIVNGLQVSNTCMPADSHTTYMDNMTKYGFARRVHAV